MFSGGPELNIEETKMPCTYQYSEITAPKATPEISGGLLANQMYF